MKFNSLLIEITSKLKDISDAPDKEAERILCTIYNISKEQLLIGLNNNIPQLDNSLVVIEKLIKKRIEGTPLAYLIGTQYFYESTFKVSKHTLIPRPETEILVDLAYETLKEIVYSKESCNVLEVGTGSGCIPISLCKRILRENPDSNCFTILSIDKSTKAIDIAIENAKMILSGHIKSITQNGLDTVITFDIPSKSKLIFKTIAIEDLDSTSLNQNLSTSSINLLVSNPPYILSSEIPTLQVEVQKEPIMALDGGIDGMDIYKHIFEVASKTLTEDGQVLLEIHSTNTKKMEEFANVVFPNSSIEIIDDLSAKPRILKLSRVINTI